MSKLDRVGMMPSYPATWTLAEYVKATGCRSDTARGRLSYAVSHGQLEVVRRGSMHGVALYRRTQPKTIDEARTVMRAPSASSVFDLGRLP